MAFAFRLFGFAVLICMMVFPANARAQQAEEWEELIAESNRAFEIRLYDKALGHAERALRFAEANFHGKDARRAYTEHFFASACLLSGNDGKAEEYFLKSLASYEEILGPGNIALEDPVSELVSFYEQRSDYQKMKTYLLKELALKEKTRGPDSLNLISVLDELASLSIFQGDYDGYIEFKKRVLAIQEKKLGKEHPDLLLTLDDLADTYDYLGRYSEGAAMLERIAAIEMHSFGPKYHGLKVTLMDLAELYEYDRNFEKAEEVLKKRIDFLEQLGGKDSIEHMRAVSDIKNFYERKRAIRQQDIIRSIPADKTALRVPKKQKIVR